MSSQESKPLSLQEPEGVRQGIAPQRSRTLRHLLLGAATLALVLLTWRTWTQLWDLSMAHVHYSHLVLIPFVSLFFFWDERHRIFGKPCRNRWTAALPGLLGVAGLLASAGVPAWEHSDQVALQVASLILIWMGIFVAVHGISVYRAALFPLFFLFLLVPIPSPLLEAFVALLQWGSTESANFIFFLSGVPYLREGYFFSIPGITIHVAPECSGIRSNIALIITAIIASKLFLRRPGPRLLLVLAALPVSVLKNGMRIAALTLLAAYVDEGFLHGGLHTRGGYPFFILALLMLAPILAGLRYWEGDSLKPSSLLPGFLSGRRKKKSSADPALNHHDD